MVPQAKKEAKRPRDEKENNPDGRVATKHRTKYTFGPKNTLSGADQSTPLKSLTTEPLAQRQQKKVSPSRPSFVLKSSDNLSSDDHIYWAPTPRQSRTIDASKTKNNIPSSPMQEFQSIKISPMNPMNTIPHQFNDINYDNFSSTQHSPEANRTIQARKSDSFPSSHTKAGLANRKQLSEKTKRLLKSFSGFTTPISRDSSTAKKTDIASLINTVESGFSASNSPFTPSFASKSILGITDETPSKLPEPRPLNTPSVVIRRPERTVMIPSAIPEKPSPKKLQDSSDLFSEDFSEDFLNDLDKVFEKKSQTQPQTTRPMAPTTPAAVPPNDKIAESTETEKEVSLETILPQTEKNASFQDDDGDAFSDSDDDFNEILLKKTQTTESQAKLTTQERHIRTVDMEGQMIFKKDIEGTDTKVDSFRRTDINLAKSAVQRPGVHRFQVTGILENHYVVEGKKKVQKILSVIDGNGQTSKVFVRDFWQTLSIEAKDVINIVGEEFRIVDKDTDNMLIWNPDLLLSATLVSDTINCVRRSVLKTRYDFPGESNIYLIVGEIVHTIFQSVLQENHSEIKFMEQLLENELDTQLMSILSIQETKDSIREQVKQHLPYIKTWFDLYVKASPQIASSVKINRNQERTLFATSNVIDIEENIWSPIYGLRGLIDVTIEAYMSDSHNSGKFAVPMELKSGARMHISHKSQAALYTLLMKDRYEMDVNFFMLVYTKIKETTKNEINKRELKDLMMLRNTLSQFMKEGSRELPDIIRQSQCDRCYAVQACMTLYKLQEDGTEETSGLAPGLFTNITEHLGDKKYTEFYNYWDDLITKEEGTINLLKRDLFLTESTAREKTSGKCLSNLVLSDSQDGESEENMSYLYTFKRKTGIDLPPMNVSQLSKFDRIIVSDESGHYALCSGFIVNVWPDTVIVRASRRLKNNNMKGKDFNPQNNQTFQTVLKPLENPHDFDSNLTFRIDKDEMFHGMKMARYNVLNLFLKDGDDKRRDIIVNGKSPTFAEKPLPYTLDKDHTFNPDQLKAFDKVLSANDFSLLLGMPGTGKTTVIAQLIRFLVKNNKTVLLTSYTHSAVDNILMKIKEDGIGVVRLGALSRIHQEVRMFSPQNKEIKTAKDVKEVFMDPPVVATTCLGINDWVLQKRNFDYCIVDESSQVSMPACLGPLRFCDKFVLVGDHYQLPPLIQNHEAKAGLSKSLFKMLSDAHPEAVVDLSYQYRMCSDIMLLSNTIIYEGRLKCGSEDVANQFLEIPHIENLTDYITADVAPENRWMDTVLDENNKVIFLDHDKVGGCEETSIKENIENQKEAELVYQIVECMLKCGVPEKSIGVMSFYRAQLRLFYRKFSVRKDIEMLTADQFQGRDKDCVIISLVKSNKRNDVGSLLREWRRLNVAITRSKKKLIIIGSASTLSNLKTIDAFMNIMRSRGWSHSLPPGADKIYSIPQPIQSPSKKRTQSASVSTSKIVQKSALAREIQHEM